MTSVERDVGGSEVRDFEDFAATEGLHLRRALLARWGAELGADLHAEVMAKAFVDWARVGAMANPTGYLYVVARSERRRYLRWQRPPRFRAPVDPPPSDPDLFLSLGALTDEQRVAVLLVHGYGATYQEVADVLGIPVTGVTNHLTRGLARLRRDLKEP